MYMEVELIATDIPVMATVILEPTVKKFKAVCSSLQLKKSRLTSFLALF